MSEPRYNEGAVRALSAAMGRPLDTHDYAITDTRTGYVKGIYASYESAVAAVERLGLPDGGLYVLTVMHPPRCHCDGR